MVRTCLAPDPTQRNVSTFHAPSTACSHLTSPRSQSLPIALTYFKNGSQLVPCIFRLNHGHDTVQMQQRMTMCSLPAARYDPDGIFRTATSYLQTTAKCISSFALVARLVLLM